MSSLYKHGSESSVCILVGFFIGGLLGALLAVPVYVTLRTLFAEWQEFRRAKVRTRNGA